MNADRFWAHVAIPGWDNASIAQCWPWTGYAHPSGYGHTYHAGQHIYAHRLAYRLFWGSVRDDVFVRHLCNNRLCCNPWHLEPGTNLMNMADKVRCGRALRPERKLNAAQYMAIRARYAAGETQYVLAADYGVTVQRVSQICLTVPATLRRLLEAA